MRTPFSIPISLALAACAGGNAAREHDAMIGQLTRVERDRLVGEDVAIGTEVLDRGALVAAVLARNPDLDAARATWRAEAAAYPAAVALEDPMVSYAVAPFSIGANVPFGQRVELSQKLPYPGKRRAAGEMAIAGAEVAGADYDALRLEIAETTVHAFDDYYVAARALEVNTQHRELIERIHKNAIAQYTAGRASQQDPLEAEAALIALDRQRLTLATKLRTATARINRLLRRPADAPLPPPPKRLEIPVPLAPGTARHPKLVAADARIRGRAAEIEGANREFYPDLELMASYDSMWSDWHHRYMIGVGISIPLQRSRRDASVERARAERARAVAELTSATDVLDEERDRAQRELAEAKAALELDETRSLPTARSRIDAALAGFTTGQNTFSTVVMAERALRDVELQIEQSRADLDRRIATLDRLSGRIAGGAR